MTEPKTVCRAKITTAAAGTSDLRMFLETTLDSTVINSVPITGVATFPTAIAAGVAAREIARELGRQGENLVIEGLL
jgi:hypothetical protein